MSVAAPARHIECEGAFNLRDLGGYSACDSRTVRMGVLYRADGLHRLPPDQTHTLACLGWRTVIDLRTTGEVSAGMFRADGVELINDLLARQSLRPHAQHVHELLLRHHEQRFLQPDLLMLGRSTGWRDHCPEGWMPGGTPTPPTATFSDRRP